MGIVFVMHVWICALRDITGDKHVSFYEEKNINKSIAQINPFSPAESSSRRVKLIFAKAGTWLANTNFCLFICFLFYRRHLYHMRITQKTREVEVTKKKKAHNIMESVQGLDTSKLLVWILAPLLLSVWPVTYLSEFHSSIVMWKYNDTFTCTPIYFIYLSVEGSSEWV